MAIGSQLDAAVNYDHGWVALFWSGLWQTERTIMARLERLGQDMEDCGFLNEPAWPGPSSLCGLRPLAAELVYRAFRRYGLLGRASWRFGAAPTGPGALSVLLAQPGLGPPAGWSPREMGGWSWDSRVRDSLWGSTGSQAVGRVPGRHFRVAWNNRSRPEAGGGGGRR